MDTASEILIGSSAALVGVYLFYKFYGNGRKFDGIPGPRGIPLLGNALQLDSKRPNETLRHWADKYGDVMKINIFGEDIIVVNGFEAMNEILVTKSADFAGRPENWRSTILYLGRNSDMAFADFSPKMIVLKKSCMKGLKTVSV